MHVGLHYPSVSFKTFHRKLTESAMALRDGFKNGDVFTTDEKCIAFFAGMNVIRKALQNGDLVSTLDEIELPTENIKELDGIMGQIDWFFVEGNRVLGEMVPEELECDKKLNENIQRMYDEQKKEIMDLLSECVDAMMIECHKI